MAISWPWISFTFHYNNMKEINGLQITDAGANTDAALHQPKTFLLFLSLQTGSGKTYTMMGPHELDLLTARDPEHMLPGTWASVGVVPRALADLFKVSNLRADQACLPTFFNIQLPGQLSRAASRAVVSATGKVDAVRQRGSARVKVVASYVEIHNNRMYDLLQPYKKGMGSRRLVITWEARAEALERERPCDIRVHILPRSSAAWTQFIKLYASVISFDFDVSTGLQYEAHCHQSRILWCALNSGPVSDFMGLFLVEISSKGHCIAFQGMSLFSWVYIGRDPYDVMQRKAALEIREDRSGSTHVPSLFTVEVPSYSTVLQLLAKGNSNRVVGCGGMLL
eukprot:1159439-Pelagomonas_calceolata.AAC.10